MSRAIHRALPAFALALGSWVGLGCPHAGPRLARAATEPVAERARPPGVEASTSTVSASLLPDPTPWPQLNPTASINRAWLLAEGPAPEPASGRRFVTFTFDDGPFPETTPVVLHVLAKHKVRATFFWIGRYLDGDGERAVASRATAREVRDAGHLIGNHTHDHARLTIQAPADALAQIDEGAASIERAVGIKPCLFRPPFGQVDEYTQGVVRDEALTLVLWNVEVADLAHDDPVAMAESLEDQIDFSGGGIVLLHDIRFTTAEALDRVLTWLDRRRYDPARPARVGYDVVDYVEFMRQTAASPQPFADRASLETARAAAWRRKHARTAVSLPRATSEGDFEAM